MKSCSCNLEWSANLAYAVGLITTDGSLSKDGRHIALTSTDKQLLQTFLTCLNKNNEISHNIISTFTKKLAFRVQIGDVKFYRWLTDVGLTPNKSLTIKDLKIDSNYFVDFLRGHLDGDGSIIYYKDTYNTKLNYKYIYDRLFLYFISASRDHIIWIQKEISKQTGLKGSLVELRSKIANKRSMWRLKFSTKEAKVLLNLIYYKKDLPCLERKRKIALPYLLYPSQVR